MTNLPRAVGHSAIGMQIAAELNREAELLERMTPEERKILHLEKTNEKQRKEIEELDNSNNNLWVAVGVILIASVFSILMVASL